MSPSDRLALCVKPRDFNIPNRVLTRLPGKKKKNVHVSLDALFIFVRLCINIFILEKRTFIPSERIYIRISDEEVVMGVGRHDPFYDRERLFFV